MADTFPLDDDDIVDAIGAVLNVNAIDAGGNWLALAKAGNAYAQQTIVDELGKLGFSRSQIVSWDRGPEFNRDLALYKALSEGAAGQSYELEAIDRYNRVAELKAMTSLMINGQQQYPGAVTAGAGRVASGRLCSDTDVFREPRRCGRW